VNDRHVTLRALEMAIKRRCPDIGLLHHSDQGCTYASEDYQTALEARGIVCSMSRRGHCYDNAVMESFFSSVKFELGERFDSHGAGKMQLFDYIEVFYNQRGGIRRLGRSARPPTNAGSSRRLWTPPEPWTRRRAHRSLENRADPVSHRAHSRHRLTGTKEDTRKAEQA